MHWLAQYSALAGLCPFAISLRRSDAGSMNAAPRVGQDQPTIQVAAGVIRMLSGSKSVCNNVSPARAVTAALSRSLSHGRTGQCWDNAAAESFFAALKNEMYHRQSFPDRARARFAVADYIEVSSNRQRLHSTLGYRTPLEALTSYQTAATAA